MKKNKKSLPVKQLNNVELEIKAKEFVARISTNSKEVIFKKGINYVEELLKKGGEEHSLEIDDPACKMMTIFELDNGWLLSHGFSTRFQGLVVNISKEIAGEYDCKKTSEKATAHLVAQSFVRMLELQRYINLQLDRESFTDMSTARLTMLEKSLEKASRQYQQHLVLLRSMKQPPINLTVKAVTANIANQQVVQELQNINAK